MYLFAQGAFAGADLVQQATDMATNVATGFNQLWGQVITGPLYFSICDVGKLFAIATLIFFIVEWTKQMVAGEEQRAFTSFIWPMIVVLFLSNNGALLGKSTLGMRDYVNNVNNYVLSSTVAGLTLRTAFEKAVGVTSARSVIGREIQECQTDSRTPQESVDCLKSAKDRLQSQYPEYFIGSSGPFSWLIQRIDRIISAPIDAIQSGANPLQVIFSPFSAIIGSQIITIVSIILLGLSGAYQWGLELTLLVTALIGPIALGGSLLPYGAKSIVTWFIGFFTVGFNKLCFNIIVGLAGQLISQSRADQPLFFLFFIGLVAPFLATGLAAGGGIAILQQLNKASDMYISLANNAINFAVTQGLSRATRTIKG
ncbi:hypothetical protein [Nostoc sp. MG11]|uniref:hypothetical protein n=1 Tax=Nostoc sp. MG11 TaxID=2721166 RepID=UPI0018660366|nr:hypothetical protein [Nostoc sp. MG11]